MDRRQPTTESETGKKGFFERKRNRVVAATLATVIGVSALAGCESNANAKGPSSVVTHSAEVTPGASQSASPGETAPTSNNSVEAKFAEAKKQYDTFVESFTPAQKAVAEKLKPENLANMSDSELQAVFAIPLTEVADANGNIDPVKYATSAVLRSQASDLAPCTDTVFAKYGGAINITSDNIKTEVSHYTNNSAMALIGTEGTVDTGIFARCVAVQSVRDLGEEQKQAVKPYEFTNALMPDSVKYDATTGNISFTTITSDNLDPTALAPFLGNVGAEPLLSRSNTVYELGLHVNEQGNVVPTQPAAQ